MYRLLITVILVFSTCLAYSQNEKYSTKSTKAIKSFDKALNFYGSRYFSQAVTALEEAIEADANFVEAHVMLGGVYADMGKYEPATDEYKKAIALQPDSFINNYYSLGKLEIELGKYNEAKEHLQKFLTKVKPTSGMVKKANHLIEICNFGENAVKNPVPFKPHNLGDSINSKFAEYLPTLTADEQTLIFTVRQPKYQDIVNKNLEQEDFYISKKQDGVWQPRKELGPPINTPGNEGAQCISPDGKYLYYTACNRPNGIGSCDIYMAERVGNQWSTPVNLGAPVNTPSWESQPSIASDGRTLYFLSSRSGGLGKIDIWKTVRQDDGSWTEPVNLGPKINTSENEASPFIHPDNTTLYFASDGHTGMGGADLYFTHLNGKGEWDTPTNMGYPINTSRDESSLIVAANGKTAYFASDRAEGKGQTDLYWFELYEKAQPVAVSYMKGKVYDSQSQGPLEATFQLIDLQTAKLVVESSSDKTNGEFLVCLPAGKEYALNVSKPSYLFYSDHFKIDQNANTMKMDVSLHAIKVGESVVLKNIFFETNDFSLKDESKAELEKLKTFLTSNKDVKIEIGGHTDNVGDKKYNQTLSEKRAKAVYDHLVAAGIDPGHLSYKGYGDSKPIAPNDTPEGKSKNRRTEFIIIAKG